MHLNSPRQWPFLQTGWPLAGLPKGVRSGSMLMIGIDAFIFSSSELQHMPFNPFITILGGGCNPGFEVSGTAGATRRRNRSADLRWAHSIG